MMILTFEDGEDEILNHIMFYVSTGTKVFQSFVSAKLFDFLKPEYKSKNDLDVTNINWTTGVYDNESGIFLTKIYYVSDGIERCGIDYHSYIVITDEQR